LTLGIITGAIWAEYAWAVTGLGPQGDMVSDHLVSLRRLSSSAPDRGMEGRKAAIMAIAGFLAVLFTFLGVNLVLPGLHSYANW